jgi:hypothetical protein
MDMTHKKEEKAAVKESMGGSAIAGAGAGERKPGRFRSLISRGGKAKEAAPDSSDSDDDDVSTTPRGSVGDDELRPQLPHHSQSVPNMVLSDDDDGDDDDDVSDGDDGLSLSAPVKCTTGAATSAHVSSIAASSRPKHHPHSDPLLSAKENERRAKRARKELKETRQKEEHQQQQQKKATKAAAKAAAKAQQLPTSPRRSAAGHADGEANKVSAANAKQKQSFIEQRVLKRGQAACDLSFLVPAHPTDAVAVAATATADDSALPNTAAAEPTAEATAAPSTTDVAATSSSTPSSSSSSAETDSASSVHADGWHSTSAPAVPTKQTPQSPPPPPLPAAAAVVAAMSEATPCEATTCDITSLVAASSAVAVAPLQPVPFVPIAVAGTRARAVVRVRWGVCVCGVFRG